MSILLPTKPFWCFKIFCGEKTIEIRKTKPKIKPPFKCLIYECKELCLNLKTDCDTNYYLGKGMVVGEFLCDKIYEASSNHPVLDVDSQETVKFDGNDSCVSVADLKKYIGGAKSFYGWHITNVVYYYKPRFLLEYCCKGKRLTRPPQSWCYVEEVIPI